MDLTIETFLLIVQISTLLMLSTLSLLFMSAITTEIFDSFFQKFLLLTGLIFYALWFCFHVEIRIALLFFIFFCIYLFVLLYTFVFSLPTGSLINTPVKDKKILATLISYKLMFVGYAVAFTGIHVRNYLDLLILAISSLITSLIVTYRGSLSELSLWKYLILFLEPIYVTYIFMEGGIDYVLSFGLSVGFAGIYLWRTFSINANIPIEENSFWSIVQCVWMPFFILFICGHIEPQVKELAKISSPTYEKKYQLPKDTCQGFENYKICEQFAEVQEELHALHVKRAFDISQIEEMISIIDEHKVYREKINELQKPLIGMTDSELFANPSSKSKFEQLQQIMDTSQQNEEQSLYLQQSFSKLGVDINIQPPYTDDAQKIMSDFSIWVDLYAKMKKQKKDFHVTSNELQIVTTHNALEDQPLSTQMLGREKFQHDLLKKWVEFRVQGECVHLQGILQSKNIQARDDFIDNCQGENFEELDILNSEDIHIEEWVRQHLFTEDGQEKSVQEVQISNYRWIVEIPNPASTQRRRNNIRKKIQTLGFDIQNIDTCVVKGYTIPSTLSKLDSIERGILRWEKGLSLRQKYQSLRGNTDSEEKWFGELDVEKELGICGFTFPHPLLTDDNLLLRQKEISLVEDQQPQWNALQKRASNIGLTIESFLPPYDFESILEVVTTEEERFALNDQIQQMAKKYNVDLKRSTISEESFEFPLSQEKANDVLERIQHIQTLQPQFKELQKLARTTGFWLEKSWPIQKYTQEHIDEMKIFIAATPKVRGFLTKSQFKNIPSGIVYRKENEPPIRVNKSFRMSRYELTQELIFISQGWELPKDKKEGESFSVGKNVFYFHPQKPIVLTYTKDLAVYLDILSRQMGYQPCDQDAIELCSKSFRFPTLEEWSYVTSARESSLQTIENSDIKKHWTPKNYESNPSQSTTSKRGVFALTGVGCEFVTQTENNMTTPTYYAVGENQDAIPERNMAVTVVREPEGLACTLRLVWPY